MRGLALATTLAVAFSAPAVNAQTDFSGLKVKPGDVVFVTDPSGDEVTGRITTLSPSALTVDGREFNPAPGLKIERRGDSVWDGALKGLAVGTVLGLLVGAGECALDWPFWKCVAATGGWFGVFGALIDWGKVGRTRVFLGTAIATSPSLEAGGQAAISRNTLAVRISF